MLVFILLIAILVRLPIFEYNYFISYVCTLLCIILILVILVYGCYTVQAHGNKFGLITCLTQRHNYEWITTFGIMTCLKESNSYVWTVTFGSETILKKSNQYLWSLHVPFVPVRVKKGKVFYGQEPSSGESTTTESGVNYQLLSVMH